MLVKTPLRFNYGGMYPDINYQMVNGRIGLDRGPFLSGLGALSMSNAILLGIGALTIMYFVNKKGQI